MTSVVEPDAGYGLRIAEPGEALAVGLGKPTLSDDGWAGASSTCSTSSAMWKPACSEPVSVA